MFGKRKKLNFLEFIPEKKVQSETDENGKTILLVEKTKNRFVKKIISAFGKSQYFKVRLDEIGSFVWEQIDGKKNVYEIGKIVEEKFKERVQPVEKRLPMFLKSMEKGKMIEFINREDLKRKYDR